jgi:hypothetical protein
VSPDAFLAVLSNTHVLKKQQAWGASDAQRVDAVRVRGNTIVGGGTSTSRRDSDSSLGTCWTALKSPTTIGVTASSCTRVQVQCRRSSGLPHHSS